jgi:DnaJ family protein C protein 12
MHWTTLKTKDRMLGEGQEESGSSGSQERAPPQNRRASEGGANIHWGNRGNVQWDNKAPSEVVNKFRNYEI